MNDAVRQKLRELVIEYGSSLCDDPRRCEALLKDYCGKYKREIFVLVSALKTRVAQDLLRAPAGLPLSIIEAQLERRLAEELAMTAEAARWAVESWALALGVIDQPSPVVHHAPVSPPSPPLPTPKVAPTRPPRTKALLIAGRYRDHGAGTVTDIQTGLQWMRFSSGQEWTGGTCVGEAQTYAWQDALDAAKALNRQGGYAGYRDWRVPTKEELETLLVGTQSPRIDQATFPNTPASWSWYWSSSVYAVNPDRAWNVLFSNGYVSALNKADSGHVRLARGGL